MNGGAAAVVAVHAIAQATKASGTIVRVKSDDFLRILAENDHPLVVHALGGFFSVKHKYLTSYRGLAFLTKSALPLSLSPQCQVVEAPKIWIPD